MSDAGSSAQPSGLEVVSPSPVSGSELPPEDLAREKNRTRTVQQSPRSFVWGDGFIGIQTHLPPKLSFSSDFGHFILKMVENAKYSSVSRKKDAKISSFLGETSPADFSTAGDASPVPLFSKYTASHYQVTRSAPSREPNDAKKKPYVNTRQNKLSMSRHSQQRKETKNKNANEVGRSKLG